MCAEVTAGEYRYVAFCISEASATQVLFGAMADYEQDGMLKTDVIAGDSESEAENQEVLFDEQVTPMKRSRLSLGDCFQMDAANVITKKMRTAHQDNDFSTKLRMSDFLPVVQTDSPTVTADTSPSEPVCGHIDLEDMKSWHPNRLWVLVYEQVLKPILPLVPKRIRSKQRNWCRRVNELAEDPLKEFSDAGSGIERSRAQDLFRRMVAKHSGASWRDCKSVANIMWHRAGTHDRYRWVLLQQMQCVPSVERYLASAKLSAKGLRLEAAKQNEEAVETDSPPRLWEKVAGVLLTYNTKVGMRSAEVLMMAQEQKGPEDFIEFMKTNSLHNDAFSDFWDFVQKLGEKVKFPTVGASMEISANGAEPGRVHFHAYVGGSIRGGPGAMCSCLRANISEVDLIYRGARPQVRPTMPKKNHPKTVFEAIVNGLYYVIAAKTTSILRKSTVWPVQDSGIYI